jgi:hypothetical protein
MPAMADFFTKLEKFTEMDATILRATRIHKLPKAILRLESIPREDEFNFKSRSTGLLEMWNKMLSDAPQAAEENASAGANGAEEEAKAAKDQTDDQAGANGADQPEAKATSEEEQTEGKEEEDKEEKEPTPAEEKAENAPEEEVRLISRSQS